MWRTERIITVLIVLGLIVLGLYIRASGGTLEDQAKAHNQAVLAQLIETGRIETYRPPKNETEEDRWARWLKTICYEDPTCPDYWRQFGY